MFRSMVMATVLAATAVTNAAAADAAAGDWLVRLRGIIVSPNESASGVMPTFPAGSISVEDAYVPELDFTYFITDHVAAELILATSPHDINGEGILAPLGKVADVMALPPTLTLQYHFSPIGKLHPYVGVGVNWTIFYDDDASQSLIDAIGPTTVDLDNSVGPSFQAGVDIDISERWFLNADIKYILMDTTATLNSGGLINTVDVDLDPIVGGIGIGYRF
jgi:outer membrane protein